MYPPLVENLRQYASKEDLSDAQVIKEWRCYKTKKDKKQRGRCICGKENIKYLYYLSNVNILEKKEQRRQHVVVGKHLPNYT